MGSKCQRCHFLPFQCGGEKVETWIEQLMDDACGGVQVYERPESDEASRLVYAQRNSSGSDDLMSNPQVKEQAQDRAFLHKPSN